MATGEVATSHAMTLLDDGVRTFLTANVRDFTGIPGLKVVNPFVQ